MNLAEVVCFGCKKRFARSRRRFNENTKLGCNFYCSRTCYGESRKKRFSINCYNCGKCFEKRQKEISKFNYCSSSCVAVINNQKFPKRGPGFRFCKTCSRKFKGENLHCSKECFTESRKHHDPEKLLESIKSLNSKLGRVPAKRELPEVAEACRYVFGSWSNAVVAAKLVPHRSHDNRMYRRKMTRASDGHACDSVSEAIVDNWLTENGIQHERNVFYPSTRHMADWKLKNRKVFIEYFGLAKDSSRYDRSIKEKRNLCLQNNIRLIEIYPQDIYPRINLQRKLKDFLRKARGTVRKP